MKGNLNAFPVPVGERLLVKRDKSNRETDSGIILPDDSVEAAPRGEIIAAGAGVTDHPEYNMLAPGTWVLLPKFAGTAVAMPSGVKEDAERYVIIRCEDILAYFAE